MQLKLNKRITIGIAVIVVLAVVGTVGALNGWFGGGATIPEDTFTRGLVGYWNMDESNGSLAKDSSPYSNDGMINDGGTGNPIAYWTFDEQTGTTAYDSIGSSNGTISSATWTSSGKVGGALSFDGVDGNYVNVPDTSILDVGGALTVEHWFKTDVLQTGKGMMVHDSSDYKYMSYITGNSGDVAFYVQTISGTSYVSANNSDGFYNDGNWHHFVGTFDKTLASGRLKVYVDGLLIATANAYNEDIVPGDEGIFIGTWKNAHNFIGSIDDVRIYNYARQDNQIRRDYLETYKSKWVQGKIAGAIQLDGIDDYIDAGNASSLNVSTAVTISAWVKFPIMPAGQNYFNIVDRSGGNPRNNYYLMILNNKPIIGVWNAGSQYYVYGSTWDSSYMNTWHQIVGVADGRYTKIYIDGKLDLQTDWTSFTIGNDTTSLYIGHYSTYYANGSIDEIKVYNRALSAAEIAFQYNRGGPVAYWKFDEGSGTLVGDISGNMNNAVIHGPSLSFDGTDDYVDAGNNTSLQVQNTFTVSGWVNSTSISAWDSYIDKGWTSAWSVGQNSSKLYFLGRLADTSAGQYSGTATLPSGWFFYTVTYDGSNLIFYLNGVQDKVYSGITFSFLQTASVSIGKNAGGGFFSGLIDEPRIYNRALSATEALEHSKGIFKDDTGLVMHLSFDENIGDTAYDKSSYSNNGNLAGSGTTCGTGGACPTWTARTRPIWTAGKYGSALIFDGVYDYLTIADSNNLDIVQYLTLEAWIKTDDLNNGAIIGKWKSGNLSYWMGLVGNSFRMYLSGNGGTAVYVGKSNSGINDNNWHYVVSVYDGSNVYLYIDGNNVQLNESSGSIPSSLFSGNADLLIANDQFSNIYFKGTIDDVRIYPYARTADEIRLDYNAGFSAKFGPSSSSCSINPGSCVTNGLVGYWNMDEGTDQKAKDSSGEGNDGWLGSSTSADISDPKWISGKVNGAMQFDGADDYITGSKIINTSNVTMSVWIKIPAIPSTPKMVVGFSGAGAYDKDILLEGSTGRVAFYIFDGSGKYVYSNATTNPLSINEWIQIVGVVDGSYMRLYFNGIEASNLSATGSYTGYTVPNVIIGKGGVSNFGYFNGAIDEVRIYNRALSAEEIRYQYNTGGPVAYWKFDEGSGTTTYDSTDNNNNGTISGATWTAGKYGQALSFDGTDDYVDAGQPSNLSLSVPFTLSAWIKRGNIAVASQIITKDWNYKLFISSNNKITFQFRDQSASAWRELTSLTAVSTNWTSVLATAESSGSNTLVNIYIDGVLNNSTTLTGQPASYAVNFRIGANQSGTEPFNGFIDDIRIYNYVRTADEIRLDYNKGAVAKFGPNSSVCSENPGSCMNNGLVGYWNMDEQRGSLALDSSGNSNDGMINDGGTGNPIAYWTFDEQTGTTAYDSIGTNNGTLTNSPVWTSSGKAGGALNFDGVDDYVLHSNISFADQAPHSFSVWVKWGTTVPTDYILPFGDKNNIGSTIYFSGLGTAKTFSYRPVGENRTEITGSDTTALFDGNWHYVTWTVNSSRGVALYIDGKQNGITTTIPTTSAMIYNAIGNGYGLYLWNGYIDDVKIYNYARAADQIKRDYSETYKSKWTQGKINGAIQLDGVDDYIDAGNAVSLNTNITNQLTMECWVKPNGSMDLYDTILESDDAGRGYRIWSPTGGNSIGATIDVPSGNNVASTLNLNAWNHIAVTYNNVSFILYVNGLNVSSVSDSGDIIYLVPLFNIGRDSVLDRYFNGIIDDVRIYNRALSAEEISYHYNKGQPVGYWKFNEGEGLNAYDSTNYSNDGILSGPIWAQGKFGSALSFDGINDYVSVAADSSLLTTKFTLSAWIKLASVPSASGHIIRRGAAEYFRVSSDLTLRGFVWGTTNGASQSTNTVPLNTWVYVTMTYDDTGDRKVRIYINGIETSYSSQTPVIGTMGNANWPTYIGCDDSFTSGNFFPGFIDDVKIYNYVRTSDQIYQDYNSGAASFK